MPNLPDQIFRFDNNAGDTVRVICRCRVNNSGIFTFVIPPEIVEKHNVATGGSIHPRMGKPARPNEGVPGRMEIEGGSIDELKKIVAEIGNSIVAEVKVEKRLEIWYDFNSGCSFATMPDGIILPNAETRGSQWWRCSREKARKNMYRINNRDPSIPIPWRLVLVAAMVEVTTTTSLSTGKSHTQVRKLWNEREDSAIGKWGRHLSKFSLGESTSALPVENLPFEVPYTEEAAEFFYMAMLSMCELSLKLDGLFGDGPKVLIEKTGNFSIKGLLPEKSGAQTSC